VGEEEDNRAGEEGAAAAFVRLRFFCAFGLLRVGETGPETEAEAAEIGSILTCVPGSVLTFTGSRAGICKGIFDGVLSE
jgi:hypothetical protein